MDKNLVNLKIKLKIFLKKIIHLNFLTRIFSRLILQRSYKTLRLFTNWERFKGTLWVEWNKELFDTWAIKKDKNLYNEAANFYQKFRLERTKIIKGLPISGGVSNATGGGGANEALLYFFVRLISAKNILKQEFHWFKLYSILESLKTIKMENYLVVVNIHLNKDQVGFL